MESAVVSFPGAGGEEARGGQVGLGHARNNQSPSHIPSSPPSCSAAAQTQSLASRTPQKSHSFSALHLYKVPRVSTPTAPPRTAHLRPGGSSPVTQHLSCHLDTGLPPPQGPCYSCGTYPWAQTNRTWCAITLPSIHRLPPFTHTPLPLQDSLRASQLPSGQTKPEPSKWRSLILDGVGGTPDKPKEGDTQGREYRPEDHQIGPWLGGGGNTVEGLHCWAQTQP
jgi:hypothetical protein